MRSTAGKTDGSGRPMSSSSSSIHGDSVGQPQQSNAARFLPALVDHGPASQSGVDRVHQEATNDTQQHGAKRSTVEPASEHPRLTTSTVAPLGMLLRPTPPGWPYKSWRKPRPLDHTHRLGRAGDHHQDPRPTLHLPGLAHHPQGAPPHPASPPGLPLAEPVQPRPGPIALTAAPFLTPPSAFDLSAMTPHAWAITT